MNSKAIVLKAGMQVRYNDKHTSDQAMIFKVSIMRLAHNLLSTEQVHEAGLHLRENLILDLDNGKWIPGDRITQVYINREWKKVEWSDLSFAQHQEVRGKVSKVMDEVCDMFKIDFNEGNQEIINDFIDEIISIIE